MAQLALETGNEMYVWEQPEVMALPICQPVDKAEILQLQKAMLSARAAQVRYSSSILIKDHDKMYKRFQLVEYTPFAWIRASISPVLYN
jgi:hypothetical protein